MKVIKPGYTYEVANFHDPAAPGQIIQFIEKAPKEEGSSEMVLVTEGTTNEELLRVLIDRVQELNKKFMSRENSLAITKLQEGLLWLEERTRDRIRRGVEGKHTA